VFVFVSSWVLLVGVCFATFCNVAQADDAKLKAKDAELAGIYNQFKENRYDYGDTKDDGRDVFLNQFIDTLLQTLSDKQYASIAFDELGEVITIASSQDNKLTLFSWDEFNGGTWHVYRAAFQYRSGANTLAGLLPVDEAQYAQAIHYKIVDNIDGAYLVKAYGTHGSGQDYYLYRLLSVKNNVVSDCSQCFDSNDMFIFEKMRALEAIPSYDPATQTLSYPQLKPVLKDGEETGFTEPTGIALTLQYSNGNFVKTTH